MRRIPSLTILLLLIIFNSSFGKLQSSLKGAWHFKEGDDESLMICTNDYVVVVDYNQVNTAFYFTSGGTYSEKNGTLMFPVEFTSAKDEYKFIGRQRAFKYTLATNKVTIAGDDTSKRTFTRLDDGTGPLAAVWQLKSRTTNGKTESLNATQKTMKIVSGTRFHYVSFNTEPKDFISCYGGRYSFKDGKYVEHIEYYRKGADKIGTVVSFDASLDHDTWTNKPNSKTGSTEVWTKR